MKDTLRRILSITLCLLMVFALAACGGKGESSSEPSSVVADASGESSSVAADSSSNTDSTVTSDETSSGSATSNAPSSSNTATSAPTSSAEKPSSSSSTATSSQNTSSSLPPQLEYEAPYQGSNAAKLNEGQTSKYDSVAETLRKTIINSKDSSLKGEVTYYVSYKGNDANSGTSPDAAWATIDKVNLMGVYMNNVNILFERGGVYRGNLTLKSNCSYGAYGSGPKPAIYGSKRNYADESLWKKSKRANVWELTVTNEGTDVGNIVFDHGVKAANKKININALKNDYDMFFANNTVYLYLKAGNPAKIHKDIEVCGSEHLLHGKGVKNVTVENLCLKYTGAHGISTSDTEGVTIRYCEIGYIGGVMPNSSVRYGNGIEFWNNTSKTVVDHCWVYQCYDAGITHQGTACVQKDITFSNNLVEYCVYNIEYFVDQTDEAEITNVSYTDNILRFAGYGWYDPTDRHGSSDTAVALICGWGSHGRGYDCTNFVIKNNILDTSYRYIFNISKANTDRNATITGNTYYQKASKNASICIEGEKTPVLVQNASQFKSVIDSIDSKAKAVDYAG